MKKYILVLLLAALACGGCSQMEDFSAKALVFTNNLVDSIPFVKSNPSVAPVRSSNKNKINLTKAEKRQNDLNFINNLETLPFPDSVLQDKSQKGRNILFYHKIMRTRAVNILKFKYIFCQYATPENQGITLLPRTVCKFRMQDYPGSQVNCATCGGTWVNTADGHQTTHIPPDGRMVSEKINNGTSTCDINYSPDFTTFMIQDRSGTNYILLNFRGNPDKGFQFAIADAHLPDVASTAIQVFQIKSPSIEIKRNAMISLLNNGYRRYKKMNIYDFSVAMLTDLRFRRSFLSRASKFKK